MEQSATISLNPDLFDKARLLAREEGLSVEQLIHQALEQGLADLRSGHFFRARAGRGNVPQALEILRRTGQGNAPLEGDYIPADFRSSND